MVLKGQRPAGAARSPAWQSRGTEFFHFCSLPSSRRNLGKDYPGLKSLSVLNNWNSWCLRETHLHARCALGCGAHRGGQDVATVTDLWD